MSHLGLGAGTGSPGDLQSRVEEYILKFQQAVIYLANIY